MHKTKAHVKKKRRVYEFYDKRKVDVTGFLEQKKSFSKEEVGRKMIFPWYLQNFHNFRNEEEDASALYKKQKSDETMR